MKVKRLKAVTLPCYKCCLMATSSNSKEMSSSELKNVPFSPDLDA